MPKDRKIGGQLDACKPLNKAQEGTWCILAQFNDLALPLSSAPCWLENITTSLYCVWTVHSICFPCSNTSAKIPAQAKDSHRGGEGFFFLHILKNKGCLQYCSYWMLNEYCFSLHRSGIWELLQVKRTIHSPLQLTTSSSHHFLLSLMALPIYHCNLW